MQYFLFVFYLDMIPSSSQASLQSWASSLSYDSHSEEINEIREFMKSFVEDIFKNTHNITVDRKAEFGKLAQVSSIYRRYLFVRICIIDIFLHLLRVILGMN